MRSNQKVLILGGAGFFGQNFVRWLLKNGRKEITVVDSLDPLFQSKKEDFGAIYDDIRFIQGDIRDEKLLASVVPNTDIIFNLAGQTSHPNSLKDPISDAGVNVIGILKVLLAVKDLNPNAIVAFSSSSTLVGKALSEVIDENHAERPLDIYSAHKGIAEKYHRIFSNSYGLKTRVIRFANLYGPYGKADSAFGFANHFINKAINGEKLTVFGDGAQIRNMLFVEDACEALWAATDSQLPEGEPFFAAHEEHLSVKEIAWTIAEIFGTCAQTIPWPEDRKKIEISHQKISSEKFRALTGWRPKYSLAEGLLLTKKAMNANLKSLD
ncbi:MAG: GDP-mannose 4,6-dehydratase [bacterium]|nr:GDP-mannose 4,6-dehydratase [bacterium]